MMLTISFDCATLHIYLIQTWLYNDGNNIQPSFQPGRHNVFILGSKQVQQQSPRATLSASHIFYWLGMPGTYETARSLTIIFANFLCAVYSSGDQDILLLRCVRFSTFLCSMSLLSCCSDKFLFGLENSTQLYNLPRISMQSLQSLTQMSNN